MFSTYLSAESKKKKLSLFVNMPYILINIDNKFDHAFSKLVEDDSK